MGGRYYRHSDKRRIADACRTGLPTNFDIRPLYNKLCTENC